LAGETEVYWWFVNTAGLSITLSSIYYLRAFCQGLLSSALHTLVLGRLWRILF